MKTLLITIAPFNVLSGLRSMVNIADGPSATSYGIGGIAWQAAVAKRPAMSLDLFSPDLDGTVEVGTCSFTVSMANVRQPIGAASLYYSGAPITIYSTDDYDLGTAKLEFMGNITSAKLDSDSLQYQFEADVSTALIEVPLLTKTFDGSGGVTGGSIGGMSAIRGNLLPMGFGKCTVIQPIWIDTINNIGMIDGYGNTVSVDGLYEGLSSYGPSKGDYPTYAALLAAIQNKTVAPGQWATCIAQGLVGLGAPQTGLVTANATFGGNRPGTLMRAWMERAGVADANIDLAAFASIDTICPYSVHYWTATQVQVKDLLTQMCASINASPIVSYQGQVTVTRATVKAAPDVIVDRSGNISPLVSSWNNVDTEPPYYLVKARASRPVSVLTSDQVNYVDTIVDQGTYNSATIYSSGNLVWKPDGSSYLYINATPAAGQALPVAPATSNSFWQRQQSPTAYADGTPLENLKPAQLGADQTAVHTAAAIAAQGQLATQNAADFNTQVSGPQKPQNYADVTSQNTAAAITGQGPGATAGASSVINSYAPSPATGNRIQFSNFEKGAFAWAIVDATSVSHSGLASGLYNGEYYLQVFASFTAANGIIRFQQNVQVNALERLWIGCGAQGQPVSDSGVIDHVVINAYFYKADGSGNGGTEVSRLTGAVQPFTALGNFVTIPSGTASMTFSLEAVSAEAGTAYVALAQPLVVAANANQFTPPTYTRGLNAVDAADVTNANTAQAIANQGALATMSAVGTGTILANSASDIVIMSNTATYTGTGPANTGTATGGSGGSVISGGSGGTGKGAANTGSVQP